MTKAEAINILELENPFLGGDDYKLLSEAIDLAIKALKAQERTDLISRQDAINTAIEAADEWDGGFSRSRDEIITMKLQTLPSAQPEPLSDAYMKAVWTWLLDYQIKAAELKGRYTPYEVLSWVANDWRKEHEGSD